MTSADDLSRRLTPAQLTRICRAMLGDASKPRPGMRAGVDRLSRFQAQITRGQKVRWPEVPFDPARHAAERHRILGVELRSHVAGLVAALEEEAMIRALRDFDEADVDGAATRRALLEASRDALS